MGGLVAAVSDADEAAVFGRPVLRSEDAALLTGAAPTVADLPVAGALTACFVRSPVAHAAVTGIASDRAQAAPGVHTVLRAADLDLPGLGELPPVFGDRTHLRRPCLAADRVRFVGEAVAVVLADSAEAAVDAAALVEVSYDPLPAVVDVEQALDPDAPLLFPEQGSNLVLEIAPDPGEPDPLQGADVVVHGRFVNQRVAPAPMECGAALAVPGPDGRLTVWVSSQAPFRVRDAICQALGRPRESVRVIAPAVGGGFGAKGGAYPEHLVVAAAAVRTGRPVRWVETRSENLVAMTHGRGQVQQLELGATGDGRLVGVRLREITDAGAYPWRAGIPLRTARLMASGVYRIPRLAVTSQLVVTNTTPTGPYRGAGRPEAAAALERGLDLLAARLGMDRVELRRRNLLHPDDFPYRTPTGAVYDSGDYGAALDRALQLADHRRLLDDQARRRQQHDPVVLGVGISCFCEISGSGSELGAVRVDADGTVVVTSGSSPHGQGHETTLSQIAARVLQVPTGEVRVVHSDTAMVDHGTGTYGSRSGQLAGSAVMRAAEQVLDQARRLAADLLEADPADVVVGRGGRWSVQGVPARAVTWAELAASARRRGQRLEASCDFDQPDGTYSFGVHVAVVEVDTDTGRVDLRRLVAVDDCGVVVNPMIVAGQVHGGLAQGVGQALFEAVVYDDAGNPLTASFADYLIPSAADLPGWELGDTVTPTDRNPLGMKGVGESGAVGSTPAVQSAVLDALSPWGVDHLDPPFTPERVWEAIAGRSPAEPAGAGRLDQL